MGLTVIVSFLADEEVTSLSCAGDVLWPLGDHQGTLRDLAEYDSGTDSTSIANHRVYNAFGELVSETDDAVDHLFAYTGRERDDETGLQYHRARYYDPALGRWLSEDPISFAAGDTNLNRMVGNNPVSMNDPTGLSGTGTGSGVNLTRDQWLALISRSLGQNPPANTSPNQAVPMLDRNKFSPELLKEWAAAEAEVRSQNQGKAWMRTIASHELGLGGTAGQASGAGSLGRNDQSIKDYYDTLFASYEILENETLATILYNNPQIPIDFNALKRPGVSSPLKKSWS